MLFYAGALFEEFFCPLGSFITPECKELCLPLGFAYGFMFAVFFDLKFQMVRLK
jgi:hypothetical protein